jgi:hypothetical protein
MKTLWGPHGRRAIAPRAAAGQAVRAIATCAAVIGLSALRAHTSSIEEWTVGNRGIGRVGRTLSCRAWRARRPMGR